MIRQHQDASHTRSRRFRLGRLVITSNALGIAKEKDIDVSLLIRRHLQGDWGDVCEEDRQANEEALIHGNRLMSVYQSKDVKLWIITEADRSVTTILLPEDY